MPAAGAASHLEAPDHGEPSAPPRESLVRLFLRFLRFGSLAWGGPVAQIGMLQAELVERERWVSPERFRRALAAYQVLPGPEAHELCVWFGLLARGRAGGLLAGLGFMLPGLVLMLALSWLYVTVGLEQPWLLAAFAGVQAAVVALVARALHRIAKHAVTTAWGAAIAAASFVAAVASVHFALALAAGGAAAGLAHRGHHALAAVVVAGLLALSAAGDPRPAPREDAPAAAHEDADGAPRVGAGSLLGSGLKTGMLTFGGAYTAIPILQRDAVQDGRWMSTGTFLDGLALGGVLPAPLIIFSTFVGFVAGGWLGALAITLGVFAPAFGFTLAAHETLERLVARPRVHAVLDGVTARVVGLIAATLLDVARAALDGVAALAIFLGALLLLVAFQQRAIIPLVILGSGLAGWLVAAR